MSKQPRHWPSSHHYISESFSEDLHPTFFSHLLLAVGEEDQTIPLLEEKSVHLSLQIKKLSTPHPLAGELGLFASEAIPAHTPLGAYAGKLRLIDHCWPIDPKECDYAWTLKLQRFMFIIDAKTHGNELAFVNDFRGLAPQPNTIPKWVVHNSTYHLIFETASPIAAGEELLIDYGADYWKAPHRCIL